jgi:hypothetical protein
MKVEDFLTEVRKLVLQFALGELPGFQELHAERRLNTNSQPPCPPAEQPWGKTKPGF